MSDSVESTIQDTTSHFFQIASFLRQDRRWSLYLNNEEGAVFERVSESEEIWKEFLENPKSLFSRSEFTDLEFFSDQDEADRSAGIASVLLITCRIRSMIFEQSLARIYSPTHVTALYIPNVTTHSHNSKDESQSMEVKIYESETMDDSRFRKHRERTTSYQSMHGSVGSEFKKHVREPISKALTMVPVDDMYYTLDYDASILEQGGDNEVLASAHGLDPNENNNLMLQKKEDEEIHGSLKHMFNIICAEADPAKLNDLKKLILDVRPSRSKWASDERVGQEQLYDALEKCLNELKNFTEHSLPFLKPVQKREAPNYFDIIKNPMDLGTMTKKLKALQYNSKSEFAKDLYLIWSNCMTYNTHPESIYRRHATAMKRKTTELLKKIPDIVIKNIGDVNDDSDDDDAKSHTKQDPPSRKLSVSGDMIEEVSLEGFRFVGMDVDTKSESVAPVDGIPPHAMDSIQSVTVANEDTQEEDDQHCELPLMNEKEDEPTDDPNLPVRVWKKLTYQNRLRFLAKRNEQFDLDFPQQEAIIRTDANLGSYYDAEDRFAHLNEERRKHFAQLQRPEISNSQDPHDEDEETEDVFQNLFLPELRYPLGAPPRYPLPNIMYPGDISLFTQSTLDKKKARIPTAPLPSMSEYEELVPPKKSILNTEIWRSILEFRRIKEIHGKIMQMQITTSKTVDNQVALVTRIPTLKHETLWKQEDLPPVQLTPSSALSLLHKPCVTVVAHVGFESAVDGALTVMRELLAGYLFTLGKTLRAFTDSYGKRALPSDILLASLSQNGIVEIDALTNYIQTDVFRYGAKLSELRKKLEVACADLESTLDGQQNEDDIQFEEAGDEIMTGNFFSDMGVDFLNIGELGLGFNKVPTALWNKKAEVPIRARVRRNLLPNIESVPDEEEASKLFEAPDNWKAVDPEQQIGLMKNWYTSRTATDMTEDEHKPKSKEAKTLLKLAQVGRKGAEKPAKRAKTK